ncbi:DUF742 domain-containing protein [Micromonospora sp. NPDC007271]|uniref:DUF742 domain-containing protein n=1 Tax=Micromonospora sp. NPDC007271 TaxID=3154587 RepID=UPI0033CBD801
MPDPRDETWFDDEAGRLVPLYAVANGRTLPTIKLDLLSMVTATGRLPRVALEPDHARAVKLCGSPITVAEVAARMKLPATITKVLLSDLVGCGAVAARAPGAVVDPTDISVLEAILDGLRRRL